MTTSLDESTLVGPEMHDGFPLPLPHVALYDTNFNLVSRTPAVLRVWTGEDGLTNWIIDEPLTYLSETSVTIGFVEIAMKNRFGTIVRHIINSGRWYVKSGKTVTVDPDFSKVRGSAK